MEKLIELLNEFDENWKIWKNWLYKWEEYDPREEYIISKNFWFIKWLVEKDKIDFDKLEKKVLKENLIRKFDEWLLMLLAIQDEPIRFLCEILK